MLQDVDRNRVCNIAGCINQDADQKGYNNMYALHNTDIGRHIG